MKNTRDLCRQWKIHSLKLKMGTRFDIKSNKFIHSEDMEKKDKTEMMSTTKLTELEVIKAMNSLNTDLQFTSETERCFKKNRKIAPKLR